MTALIHYDQAKKALILAKNTDEVKQIRNAASAMREYARQAKDRELELDAVEIRIRAERRLGEMLRAQKETVGLNTGAKGLKGAGTRGSKKEPRVNAPPTLAEAGIDKKLSMCSQALALIPDTKFESALTSWRIEEGNSSGRIKLNIGRNGGPKTRNEDTDAERIFTHKDFDISKINPWNVSEARNLLGRFLKKCFQEWWKTDRQALITVVRRELEWMEKQDG